MNSITAHLEALRTGQPGAAENLLTEVYQSLHRIAASRLSRNGSRITMHPTELVNEAWIRLCQSGSDSW